MRSIPLAGYPNNLLSLAMELHQASYSVIPLYDKLPYDPLAKPYLDKKTGAWVQYPCLSWKQFARVRASTHTIKQWFDPAIPADRQPNGVGIFCGSVSGGLQCIDHETEASFLRWVKAAGGQREINRLNLCIIKTGRGYHILFNAPHTRNAKSPDVELRGDLLYIAAAGSWHPGAKRPYVAIRGDLLHLPTLEQAEADNLCNLALPAPAPAPPASARRKAELPRNACATDLRHAFNQAVDVRDLIVEFGGRLAHGRLYHCPASDDHAHGDSHGSLLVSYSTRPDRYGEFVAGCYNPACRLYTGPGRVLAAFDLLQILSSSASTRQLYQDAARRIGLAYTQQQRPALAKPQRPGRPTAITDQEYRERAALLRDGSDEHGNPKILMTVAALAEHMGISEATAHRIEKRLRGRGEWHRTQAGPHGSYAVILPGLNAIATYLRGIKTHRGAENQGCQNPVVACDSEHSKDRIPTAQNAQTDESAIKACYFVPGQDADQMVPPATPAPSPTPPAIGQGAGPRVQLAELKRKLGPLYGLRAKHERAGQRPPAWLRAQIATLESEIATLTPATEALNKNHTLNPPSVGVWTRLGKRATQAAPPAPVLGPELDSAGWRIVHGDGGTRGVHSSGYRTGLYLGRDGVLKAIDNRLYTLEESWQETS